MPNSFPTGFDTQYLEMARRDIEAGSAYPLNPRDRTVSDYRLADMAWLHALAIHMQWIAYEGDLLKESK